MSDRREVKLLIIDDIPRHVDPLINIINERSKLYKIAEYQVALDRNNALEFLENKQFDLIILDIKWGENKPQEGIEILKIIRNSVKEYSQLPIIMLTYYGEDYLQRLCLENGCDGFMVEKLDLKANRLRSVEYIIGKALTMGELRKEHLQIQRIDNDKDEGKKPSRKLFGLSASYRDGVSNQTKEIGIFGTSKAIKQLIDQIIHIAADPVSPNVLIGGETGVGKTTVARMIHHLSARSDKPFQEIILNSIPRELRASILFGIEARIATGVEANKGIIEECAGGTLFLDEIGDLELPVQIELLRALRDKVIRRVGGKKDISVDFKLITATNVNLIDAMEAELFRLDLYQRIRGVELKIPSLRDRFKEDPWELENLLKKEMEKREFEYFFTDEAKQLMLGHSWPGNYAEFRTLLDNLALENTTLVDANMVKARLLQLGSPTAEGSKRFAELLNTQSHKEAVLGFRKEHMNYWIKKEGSKKDAAIKMGINESTINRIMLEDHEQE
jgi:DNA-binding NtrC family response regulator